MTLILVVRKTRRARLLSGRSSVKRGAALADHLTDRRYQLTDPFIQVLAEFALLGHATIVLGQAVLVVRKPDCVLFQSLGSLLFRAMTTMASSRSIRACSRRLIRGSSSLISAISLEV